MTLKEIQTLCDYDRWATNRTLESVSALSDAQFGKDLGSSHGGVQGTLVHTFSADTIWFDRWKGNAPTAAIKVEEVPTFQILKQRWETHQKEFRVYVDTLTEQKLHSPFDYRDFKGNPHAELLHQQIQHKVNHSSYHRGQVVTMLRQLGAKPLSTDLINYFRLQQKNG